MYICMCIYMCIYIHITRIHIYTFISEVIHVYMYVYVHTYMYSYVMWTWGEQLAYETSPNVEIRLRNRLALLDFWPHLVPPAGNRRTDEYTVSGQNQKWRGGTPHEGRSFPIGPQGHAPRMGDDYEGILFAV